MAFGRHGSPIKDTRMELDFTFTISSVGTNDDLVGVCVCVCVLKFTA